MLAHGSSDVRLMVAPYRIVGVATQAASLLSVSMLSRDWCRKKRGKWPIGVSEAVLCLAQDFQHRNQNETDG
jgi:hypothetical protein